MAITPNAKPGKIWHIWQNTKLAGNAVFNASERPKLKNAGMRALVGVGGAAFAYFTWPILIVGWIGGAVGAVVCVAGFKSSYDQLGSLKESRYGQAYLKERLDAWKARQAKGGYIGIFKKAVKTTGNQIGKAVGLTALATGVGAAVIGCLHLAGVESGFVSAATEVMTNAMTTIGFGEAAALPVAFGVAAVGSAAGGMVARSCHRNLKNLGGSTAKKPAAPKVPDWLAHAEEVTAKYTKPGFNGSAKKPAATTAKKENKPGLRP